jgi:hypothetical protein
MFKINDILIYTGSNNVWRNNKYRFKVNSVSGLIGLFEAIALQDVEQPNHAKGALLTFSLGNKYFKKVNTKSHLPGWW